MLVGAPLGFVPMKEEGGGGGGGRRKVCNDLKYYSRIESAKIFL